MLRVLLFLSAFLLVTFSACGQAKLAALADEFLKSLDKELQQKVMFDFESQERFNWNFVPIARRGVSLHDLNVDQKAKGFRLLNACLAEQGYQKAIGIIELEAILREVEGRSPGDSYRDPLKYYFSFFGKPSTDGIWGWRLEGHHLSLNFSSANGILVASTPGFMGANPAIVPSGAEKGRQTLKLETELGFELVNSLSQEQMKIARFSEKALPEIISGNDRKAKLLEPKGIAYSSLDARQKEIFDRLLNVYVKNYELGFAETLMAKIRKAGFDNLSFAWAGSLKPGDGHYYRIQGPVLLIEYDNTQTGANHVHTAVRDLTNDFAEDILREHYQKHH